MLAELRSTWAAHPAQVDPACLAELGLGEALLTRSRTNGFANMLEVRAPWLMQLAGLAFFFLAT